ncbi:MAG TPA: ATP synthase F1 subunit delta [Caldithrix abyssi]|uniref:ATP synthase subunit delta n=1 Tax=Caldithrix abyssi TaxID=187145 RepID=A0A7V4WVY4_CALAY|nr:ATP synthase F1 subunit delta [Caldithrix abyssi]
MSRVAKRYAKALFELAEERKVLEKVYEDLQTVSDTIKDSEELRNMLVNPLVNEADKLKALNGIFSGPFQDLTRNFIELIAEKRRLPILPDIISKFYYMMLEYNNQVEGQLVSAVDLEARQVQEIGKQIERITGKKVILSKRVEPSIIGGFVVKVEDMVIDSSIRSQLNRLREQLIAR